MRKGLSEKQKQEVARRVGRIPGPWRERPLTDELRAEHPALKHCDHIWFNNRVEVRSFPCRSSIGGIVQLTIQRYFYVEDLTWVELQKIKAELFGEHTLALEVFPPAAVEIEFGADIRVLWIMPSDWVAPFGLHRPEAFGNPM